jgi:sulfur-carrier protein
MPVVRLRGPLKQLAGNQAEHAIEGASVAELLQRLEREHPATSGWILDERGAVRRHINVFVNGELGDPETAVAPDDRIDVLPALSGGR